MEATLAWIAIVSSALNRRRLRYPASISGDVMGPPTGLSNLAFACPPNGARGHSLRLGQSHNPSDGVHGRATQATSLTGAPTPRPSRPLGGTPSRPLPAPRGGARPRRP